MNWQSEKVYHDGDSFFQAVLSGIETAEESVHLEYYIFTEGLLAERLIEKITVAAQRGVKIKLSIDGIGSLALSNLFLEKIKNSGAKVRIYNPLPRPFFFFTSGFWRRLFRMNRRNHRKLCLIDNKILFVGGMNIDDWHLSEVKGKQAWRDTGVRVTGEDLSSVEKALERIWQERRQKDEVENQLPILLNDGMFRRHKLNKTLIRHIKSSKTRVWLTSPYFSPPARLLVALIRSARRGVDTKILLPAKPDHFFSRTINGLFYPMLLRAGVRIYEYMTSTLHAKTAVIDQWVLVGTSNKNYRSFFYDLEIDVVLSSPESIKAMEEQFHHDLSSSRAITLKKWNERHWFYRLIEKLLWLVHKWT
jgi:cardiolipin synthase A/B